MGDEDSVKFPEGDAISRLKLKDHHIENATIRCTACWNLLDIKNDPEKVKEHPDLGTILCEKCLTFYGTGQFSQDEDGDNYCRWCAEGGHLIACDSCKNVFCDKCIRKNFGRTEQHKVKKLEVWHCYICDSVPLKPLTNASEAIQDYIGRQNSKAKSRQKKKTTMNPKDKFSDLSSSEGKVCWLVKHFSRVLNNLDTDKRTVRKIKSKLENHKDVPRRVQRCGLKLQDYLNQHINECNTLLESLKSDAEKHKCEDTFEVSVMSLCKPSKSGEGKNNAASSENIMDISVSTINDSVFDVSERHNVNELNNFMDDSKLKEKKCVKSPNETTDKDLKFEKIGGKALDEPECKGSKPTNANDLVDFDETLPLITCDELDSTLPTSIVENETIVPISDASVNGKDNESNGVNPTLLSDDDSKRKANSDVTSRKNKNKSAESKAMIEGESDEDSKKNSNKSHKASKSKAKSDEKCNKIKAKSDKDGGEIKAKSDKDGGEIKAKSDKDGGEIKAKSDKDGGEIKAKSDKDGGGIKAKSVKDGGEIKAKSVKDGGEIKAKSVKDGGEIKAKSDKDGGEIKAKSDKDGGEIKAKSDKDGGEIKAKSDKDGGEIKAKSDKDGVEIKAKSDKDGGEIKAKSDKDGGEIKAKSDKDGGEIKAKSDKDGGEIKAKSDKDGGEIKAKSDKDGGEIKAKSNEDSGDLNTQSNEDSGEIKTKYDEDSSAKKAKSDENSAKIKAKSKKDSAKKAKSKDIGEIKAKSDEDNGEVKLKSDENSGEIEAKSDENSGEIKAKSDENSGEIKAKSDNDSGEITAKSDEDNSEINSISDEDSDEVKVKSDKDKSKVKTDVLKVDRAKVKQSRREKLSSTYRKKYGSPNSKKCADGSSTSSSSPIARENESAGYITPTNKEQSDSDPEDIFKNKSYDDSVPVSSFLVELPDKEQSNEDSKINEISTEQALENLTKLMLSESDDDNADSNHPAVPLTSLLVENLHDVSEIKENSVKKPQVPSSLLFLSESDGYNTEALPESTEFGSPIKRSFTNKNDYEKPSPKSRKKNKQNLKSLGISLIDKDSPSDINTNDGDVTSNLAENLLESTVLNTSLDQKEKAKKNTNYSKNDAAKAELLSIVLSSDGSDGSKKKVKKKKLQSTTKVDMSSDEDNDDDFKKPPKSNVKSKIKKEELNENDWKKEVDFDKLLQNDKKIISQTKVVVKRLPGNLVKKYLSGDIKSMNSTILHGIDSDDDDLLDRKIARLAELPSPTALKNTPSKRSVKTSPKKKPTKDVKPKFDLESSASNSDVDNEIEKSNACLETNSKFKLLEDDDKENLNAKAMKDLLNEDDSDAKSDDSLSSLDSGKVKVKGEKKHKTKPQNNSDESSSEPTKRGKASDSSDDFVLKRKKRPKYDKFLELSVDETSNTSNKSEKSTANKGKGGAKKAQKRKLVLESNSSSESSSSLSSLDSDNVKAKKAPTKKRRRIRKIVNSSDSDSDVKEVNEDGNTPGTPSGKGRKNIKKVIGEENLDKATKRAAMAEKDRRKRVQDRQKHYNTITEGTVENGDLITRKLVLEVHKESKEELVEIPPDIVEKLKPHQVNGVKFMWECVIESTSQLKDDKGSGCVLAHCMGLGKTLQVIAFLATLLTNPNINKKIRKALVVCPYNTILNWGHEFKHWLKNTDLKINVYQLSTAKSHYDRADMLEKWSKKGGALIIGYDSFRNLTGKSKARVPKKIKDIYYACLVDPGPDIVVCDEGHILKNSSSAIAKAMNLIRTGRRVVLTGTPLQNNLKEYHTMVHFVKPHLIGTEREFRNRFVNPINNGQCADSTPQDVKLMKKRVHILHKLLEGCVQRCDYSHVAKFLPPKCEYVLSIKLSEKQVALYKHYLEFYAMNKNYGRAEANGTQLFKDFAILRLIWTHPLLMKMNQKRVDEKAWKDELNDDEEEDEDSMGSFIDDRSDPCTSDDADKPSTSKEKTNNSETSASDKSSADTGKSSGDEVISKWTTRKRNGTVKESEPEIEPIKKELWWQKIVPEEEINKIETSGKMLILFDILRDCSAIGDKVLIFSQSLLTLDLIEELLNVEDKAMEEEMAEESIIITGEGSSQHDTSTSKNASDAIRSWTSGLDYFRMDGSTSADLRKKWIEIFNDGSNERARLFLISTKAGSLGTNLIGANRVILMDASWNPTHDVQAIFRVYRFGQNKPVYIYRFLAQGTMEEKIYDRQVTKQSLACRVVDEQQIERHFNAADLAELYSFNPDSASKRTTPMIPKDRLLADMILRHKNWIVGYHEHDSLLQNIAGEDLTEDERKAAWTEYENEREGISQITNEYGAAYECQPPHDLFNSLRTKFPNLLENNIYQIMNNYLQSAIKRRQELYKRNSIYVQQKQQYPQELLEEVQKLNLHIEELTNYIRAFRERLAKQFAQQRMQQEILQQQRAQQQRQWQAQNLNMQAKMRAAFQQNVRAQFQQHFAGPQFQQTRPNIIINPNLQSYARNINITKENLQARNTANNISDMSKLLNDLKARNININVASSSQASPSQGYKVSYVSPKGRPPQTRLQRGPIITEVDDDLPIPISNRNDNNPVITEID